MSGWSAAGAACYVGLGPTELTAHALCGAFEPASGEVNIGTPAANVRAYVIDPATDQLQPFGIVGELCVAGEDVALGYWSSEQQRAVAAPPAGEVTQRACFIDDPWAGRDATTGRMHRTGDLAVALPSGRVRFVGRRDAQIKLRGFRIETSEIVAAMSKLVSGSHVVLDKAGENLVAYITPANADVAQIRRALEATLPP